MKYRGGKEPLCSSSVDLDRMGASIGLYFRLMKYLSFLFLLMSLIAVPILYICRVGVRVAPQDVDPFKLNVWSLGNVNVDRNITLADGRVVTPSSASYLIALCDVSYSLLFLLFIFFWRYKVRAVSVAVKDDFVRLSDYSVMVKHLPRFATARDVHDHFNALYNLSKPDWTFVVRVPTLPCVGRTMWLCVCVCVYDCAILVWLRRV